MGTISSPQPYAKQRSDDRRWLDVMYIAMIVGSISGLAYIFFKG